MRGPLTFLPSWVPPLDDPTNQVEMLSGTGALEAFKLGVQLQRLGLTHSGTQFTVWAASQQRCVDTAQWFLQGYLSPGHYNVESLGKIVKMADSVNYTFANSLTATNSCPRYVTNETFADNYRTSYRSAITSRLNQYIRGYELTEADIGAMMDLCGFQTEIAGSSPFCDVFTASEWKDFEYAMDLQYYYGSGPGNPLSGTTFWPYLKAVTDLFSVGPGKTTSNTSNGFIPPSLLMSFTHDNDITPLISALGLFNESSYAPLDPIHPKTTRKFRTSYAITFAGRVALERLSCDLSPRPSTVKHTAGVPQPKPSTEAFVRIKVNDAVVPLSGCSEGPGGSCRLSQFVKYVESRGRSVGDFIQTCGQTANNGTSLFTAFVDPSSAL